MHANVHLDSVSIYYTNPGPQPNGNTWGGFGKSINVTLQITGGPLSALTMNTFAMQKVGMGAAWGKVVTFSLTPGSYNVTAVSIDQRDYHSSASVMMTLQ